MRTSPNGFAEQWHHGRIISRMNFKLNKKSSAVKSTVGHESQYPYFHKKYMEGGVMICVAHYSHLVKKGERTRFGIFLLIVGCEDIRCKINQKVSNRIYK